MRMGLIDLRDQEGCGNADSAEVTFYNKEGNHSNYAPGLRANQTFF